MNADRLLKHFEVIGEAEDVIPRLRQLILDLAIRGKLAEQDPDDEPAQVAEVSVNTKIAYPNGWRPVLLGKQIALKKGKKPNVLNESGRGLPYLDIAALERGELRQFTEDKKCPRATPDDIVIVCDGSRSGLVLDGRDGVLGSTVAAIHFTGFSRSYLRLLLNAYYADLNGAKKGAAIPHLNIPRLLSLEVGLPPPAEQHRIVAKVDELMALCDELEAARTKRETRRDHLVAAALHRLNNGDTSPETGSGTDFKQTARFYFNHLPRLATRLEHIKQLRQTILNLAVCGKLFPQDPNDKSVHVLLKDIRTEKERLVKTGRIRKESPFSEIAEEERPYAVPIGWVWERIGNIALFTEYGTSVRSSDMRGGVPVLKMGDIQDGQVQLGGQKKVLRTIPDLPQLFLKKYDLLYNRTNSAELVGKTGIYLGDDDTYTFASYLIRICFHTAKTNPTYINLAMNAPYFRATQIVPELTQQCGQANVNGTKLRNMLIPLPPLTEQNRIVAKVNELMALCDELEAQLTTTATTRCQLLEATLHEALTVADVA